MGVEGYGSNSASTAARMGACVIYEGVQKHYGPVVALRSTSLNIQSGEFLSIIGPSGSGKTTLLGITVGYIPPTAGHIKIDGVDIVGVPPFKRNIGMVFQNYSLFPHMTIAENIAFPLRMRGVDRGETADRVNKMLSMVRLPGFGDRKPSELSGGQQQRVALARAAVYNPLLLLMDEPLSALDKNLREEMQYELKQFQRQLGATVLYVTHDQNEAAAMSDRIGIMNEGSLVQLGTARELYEHPANRFVASFLGEANIFRLETHASVSRSTQIVRTAGGIALKVAAGQGGSYACVRPEAISISTDGDIAGNALTGILTDATFTAGSILYRVTADGGEPVIVRMPSARKQSLEQPGTRVRLAWKVSDTLLIAD